MHKAVTIKDIARECGVSLSTVSLVINGNPRISEKTRQRVMEAVRKHDYKPNAQARGLVSRASYTLSVVVPELGRAFGDIYYGPLIGGIYECATERGYKLMLDMNNETFRRRKEYIDMLKTGRVDGMLFIATNNFDQFLAELVGTPYAALVVNNWLPGQPLSHVAADYAQSARVAGEHILGLGHRQIGVIGGTNVTTAELFNQTLLEVLEEAGIDPDSVPFRDGGFTEPGGFEAARSLTENRPDLTALIAGNDRMAIGALRYLEMKGRKVPKEISVIGVDDIATAAQARPALTTVRHDYYRIGYQAAEQALALFKDPSQTIRDLVPVELVTRVSTGPAPA